MGGLRDFPPNRLGTEPERLRYMALLLELKFWGGVRDYFPFSQQTEPERGG